jgi:hypothetical protein
VAASTQRARGSPKASSTGGPAVTAASAMGRG